MSWALTRREQRRRSGPTPGREDVESLPSLARRAAAPARGATDAAPLHLRSPMPSHIENAVPETPVTPSGASPSAAVPPSPPAPGEPAVIMFDELVTADETAKMP